MKKGNSEIIKGLTSYLLYVFIGELILYIILAILGIKISTMSPKHKIILSIIYEFILIIAIISINFKTIKKHFKDYKKNYKKYFKKYFKYWIFFFLAMIASNIIIASITSIKTATNQDQVLDALDKYPFYTAILSILLAPILEELVFRFSFRQMIKDDNLFIILSGLSFGLLHMTDTKTLAEFLYIIPYTIPGIVLAYTLVKSKNIFVPMSLHLFHNSILLLFQFILVLL